MNSLMEVWRQEVLFESCHHDSWRTLVLAWPGLQPEGAVAGGLQGPLGDGSGGDEEDVTIGALAGSDPTLLDC